jgi:hypothetical protein
MTDGKRTGRVLTVPAPAPRLRLAIDGPETRRSASLTSSRSPEASALGSRTLTVICGYFTASLAVFLP